jgi:hypothetical protein
MDIGPARGQPCWLARQVTAKNPGRVHPAGVGDLVLAEQPAQVVGRVAALGCRLVESQGLERGLVERLLELVSRSVQGPRGVWGVGLDLDGVRSPVADEVLRGAPALRPLLSAASGRGKSIG